MVVGLQPVQCLVEIGQGAGQPGIAVGIETERAAVGVIARTAAVSAALLADGSVQVAVAQELAQYVQGRCVGMVRRNGRVGLGAEIDLGVDPEALPRRLRRWDGQRERFHRCGGTVPPAGGQGLGDDILALGLADYQQLPGQALQPVAQAFQPGGERGQRPGFVQRIIQRLEILQALQSFPAMIERRHRAQACRCGGQRQQMTVVGDRLLALGAHLSDQLAQAR